MSNVRKINTEEVGLAKRYYPIIETHDLFAEGGRKMHIIDNTTGRCLCGYSPFVFDVVNYERDWKDIVQYLSQPDPDKNFCQRCKNIMINALKIK